MLFNSEIFIQDVENLMSWNCGKVTQIDDINDYAFFIDKNASKCNYYFSYKGLDGQSICRSMQKDICKLGYKCIVRVISNTLRNRDHEYLICVY